MSVRSTRDFKSIILIWNQYYRHKTKCLPRNTRINYYGKRFTGKQELVQMIHNYIAYYNDRRVQRDLGVLTPMEKHDLYLAAWQIKKRICTWSLYTLSIHSRHQTCVIFAYRTEDVLHHAETWKTHCLSKTDAPSYYRRTLQAHSDMGSVRIQNECDPDNTEKNQERCITGSCYQYPTLLLATHLAKDKRS